MFFGFDSYYMYLVLPAILFSLYAQAKVWMTFNKFKNVRNARGITGSEVARRILDSNGLRDVRVEAVSGRLSDHYDPKSRVVRLSQDVYSGYSIGAVGVSAHETGHAIQHANGYAPLVLRSTLVPVASFGSMAGPYMAIAGLIFNWSSLLYLGILFFAVAVLFYIVTLPVEFDASKRATNIIEQTGLLSDSELKGARKVLRAAAMTYVASAAVAMMSLLRLILLANGRNRS